MKDGLTDGTDFLRERVGTDCDIRPIGVIAEQSFLNSRVLASRASLYPDAWAVEVANPDGFVNGNKSFRFDFSWRL